MESELIHEINFGRHPSCPSRRHICSSDIDEFSHQTLVRCISPMDSDCETNCESRKRMFPKSEMSHSNDYVLPTFELENSIN